MDQLATLSKLELADSDKIELHKDLEQMLTYVDRLSQLNIENTLPLTHFPECIRQIDSDCAVSSASVQSVPLLRSDTPRPSLHPEQFTALAPKQDASYYIVPNTFHND